MDLAIAEYQDATNFNIHSIDINSDLISSALLLRDPAHRYMQLEAHCVENIQNSCELWLFWIACKRTMKALPRKPRFLRKVRNVVQAGGGANGMTNFGDIRLLKRLIYEIGSRLPGARLWAGRGPDRFFRHVTSNKIGRHFCRPSLLEKSK